MSLFIHVVVVMTKSYMMMMMMTGAGCALLGESGAMACTVAVEDLVTKHYDDQVLV